MGYRWNGMVGYGSMITGIRSRNSTIFALHRSMNGLVGSD